MLFDKDSNKFITFLDAVNDLFIIYQDVSFMDNPKINMDSLSSLSTTLSL